jgi:hypothetical protein
MPKTNGQTDLGAYALVADRITLFKQAHPNGQILTDLKSRDEKQITFRARVYREPSDTRPSATGWASEIIGDGEINEVACLENTETSAVGRALANLGFTASRARPSAEEMLKATRARTRIDTARQTQRPMMVRDGAPSESATSRDIVFADAMFLVDELERAKVLPDKVREAKEALRAEEISIEKIERIERTLRRWLQDHRQGRGPN